MRHVAWIATVAVMVGALAVALGASPPAALAADALCQKAEARAQAVRAKVPVEVDSVTNTTDAAADCGARLFAVAREIDLKHARMEADFKDFLTKQITEHACADATERALADAGWMVRYANAFSDGPVVNVDVACK